MVRGTCISCLAIALAACAIERGRAAEVRLQSEARPAATIVRLGDVAEIFAVDAAEAERLAAIELMPSPPVGTKRYVRARDLMDALAVRGVNLGVHRFSGASVVTVSMAIEKEPPPPKIPPPPIDSRRAVQLVATAIETHLKEQAGDQPWQLTAHLSDEAAQKLSTAHPQLKVQGGASPWTGRQSFVVQMTNREGACEVAVEADVSLPPAMIVAARPIPRGATIRAADLASGYEARTTRGTPVERIEGAVGQEATRTIGSGEVVTKDMVRAPVLVQRGDVVTVYARTAGLQVRTTARAREEGAMGELVTVESLLNREAFFTRVCGIQEVEIYARALDARAAAEPAGGTP